MLAINIKKHLASFTFEFKQNLSNQGVTAILGVSGSGKSTLINLLNGLLVPDSGNISLNNKVLVDTEKKYFIPPEKRNIGTVFQDALLFPHLNIMKNLKYGLSSAGNDQIESIINLLDINHLLNRYPAKLSGGEKQRVAIGRALLRQPSLLLMDEPLSALDMPRKKELLDYIERLTKQLNLPILYITHNLSEVKRIAQSVVVLEQGKVLTYGDTKQVLDSHYLKDWL